MTGPLIIAVACALIVGAAIFGDWFRKVNARLEEQRRVEDLADFRAQYGVMTRDERRRLHEDQAMALGNDEPIYAATWAYVFSHQLEDPAAVDRFLGRGA